MLIGLYAYLMQDWRDLQLAAGITVLMLTITVYFFLPESPRQVKKRIYHEEK